jgi:hypothetical protein
MVFSKDFDSIAAMESHLKGLQEKKDQLETLIRNVTKTISAMKGTDIMTDEEKFEGFKEKLIEENEEKYGEELREKYGEETVSNSNARIKGMTQEDYEAVQKLSDDLRETLKAACEIGDPGSELAMQACELHKRWLTYFWDHYSREAHRGIAEMYVADPRFTEYYEKIIPGGAVFLRDAIKIFTEQ